MKGPRYIEKSTGKWWQKGDIRESLDGFSCVEMHPYEGGYDNPEKMSREEFEERFEYAPWPDPVMKIDRVEARHPMRIVLYCPECGAKLVPEGGALLTYPAKYEHKCSNKDCVYGGTYVRSYYSGEYVAVTDEQEKLLKSGEYDETEHGKLIRLDEKDLWKF